MNCKRSVTSMPKISRLSYTRHILVPILRSFCLDRYPPQWKESGAISLREFHILP